MLSAIKKTQQGNFLLLVVLFFLLFYVVYRAYYLSFTHDEALSFEIILGNKAFSETANNHFLNTFLMSICYKFFGSSEFSLRLPNILGFILYAFACFELLKNKNIFIILVGISFLLLNPYLIDFFSLARGYGLALGFFMLSLLYLLKATQVETLNSFLKNASLTMLFSVAACFSNLTYINANLVILLLLLISFMLVKKDFTENRKIIVLTASILFINLCCLARLVNELLKLRNAHELYYGGSNGFIADTINGLVLSSLYFRSDHYSQLFKELLCYSIIIAYIIMLVYVILKKKYNKLSVIIFFLSLMIIAPLIQYMFLGALLPSGRTALLYIPLMGISISLFLEYLFEASSPQIARHSIQAFSFFFFFIPINYNFITNMNLNKCYDWGYDMNSKNMLLELNRIRPKTNSHISLGITWFFEPSINFYRKTLHLDWLNEVSREGLKPENDYYYITNDDKIKIPRNEIKIINCYQLTQNCLLENIKKIRSRTFIHLKTINNKYVCVDEFKNNRILGNKGIFDSCETFTLIIFINNECAISSNKNLFLSAELDQHNQITATRTNIADWETFTMIELENDYVVFKAFNGKYLNLDEKSLQIFANGDSIGEKEKFKLIKINK